MAKNYYLILGVSPDATQNEIQSAYRRQAKEVHPDHSAGSSESFIDVQEAYSVLGDPTRRRTYDASIRHRRSHPLSGSTGPEPLRPEPPAPEPLIPTEGANLDDISLTRSFETFRPSYDELIDRLRDNFTGLTRPKAERLEGLHVEIPLSREQALRGGHARIRVPARFRCPTCGGYGGLGLFPCWRCEGAGAVTGEYPLSISYPAGLTGDHTLSVSLDHLGIQNFYLTVHFRISEME